MSTDFIFLMGPRASGKTSVANAIGKTLLPWHVIDLDAEFQHRQDGGEIGKMNVESEAYYQGSQKILMDSLRRKQVIMALGGGTLINSKLSPDGCAETVAKCKERGKMILLLPSRFHFLGKRTLFEREKQRPYLLNKRMNPNELKAFFFEQYDSRIAFFQKHADFTLYGNTVEAAAEKIIRQYKLR